MLLTKQLTCVLTLLFIKLSLSQTSKRIPEYAFPEHDTSEYDLDEYYSDPDTPGIEDADPNGQRQSSRNDEPQRASQTDALGIQAIQSMSDYEHYRIPTNGGSHQTNAATAFEEDTGLSGPIRENTPEALTVGSLSYLYPILSDQSSTSNIRQGGAQQHNRHSSSRLHTLSSSDETNGTQHSMAFNDSTKVNSNEDHSKDSISHRSTGHLPTLETTSNSKDRPRIQRAPPATTEHTNSASVDYRIATYDMEALKTQPDDTVVTSNFIFIKERTTYINADYITIVRKLNFTNLDQLLSQIDYIARQHNQTCHTLDEFTINTDAALTRILNRPMKTKQAYQACESRGYRLPEVRTAKDRQELLKYLQEHGMTRTFANVQYNAQTNEIVFNSDRKNAVTPHITFCANNDNRDIDQYTDKTKNWPWTYLIHRGELTLCPHDPRWTQYPVCFMKATSTKHGDATTDVQVCQHRQSDIEQTQTEMEKAIIDLKNSVDIHQPFSFFKGQHNIVSRAIFTTILVVITAISALASSCAALMALAQTRPNYDQAIQDLEVNTRVVATEFDDLQKRLEIYFNQTQTYNLKVREEDVLYTSFLRIVMTLQDNLIMFQNTITAIQYDMVTPELLSPTDLEKSANDIRKRNQVEIDPHLLNYHVTPVIVDNSLAVEITIPILENQKEASLFSVHPYPTFLDNTTKVTPDCQVQHIAIYKHSSDFAVPTEQEAVHCSAPREKCTINSPKFTSNIDNCAAKEFFGKDISRNVHSTDISAFLLNVNNTIYYSVPSTFSGYFHCQSQKAGPDNTVSLSGKGHFRIPPGCRFESHDYGAEFDLPRQLHVSHSFGSIEPPFKMLERVRSHGFFIQ